MKKSPEFSRYEPIAPNLYDTLLLYAARWRLVVALTLLPVLTAVVTVALMPVRYRDKAVVLAEPSGFADRLAIALEWRLIPTEDQAGVRALRVRRAGGFLEVTLDLDAAGPDSMDRVLAWIGAQPRPSVPLAPLSAGPEEAELAPRAPPPPPTRQALDALRDAVRHIEDRLPSMPPSSAGYWSARALTLQARIDAGETAIAGWPATQVEIARARRPPPILEQVTVLSRAAPETQPRPWRTATGGAGTAGLLLALVGVAVHEWFRIERAARPKGGPDEAL